MFMEEDFSVAYDYGLNVKAGEFECKVNQACIPSPLTLAYAIAFCVTAKASNISLVGLFGYDVQDARQKELQDLLSLIRLKNVNLRSLTPTTFAIPEISIYGI